LFNNEENDKKINNDGNTLIIQPEDGEKAGITESIDNLIVDEESTTATTPKLLVVFCVVEEVELDIRVVV
jgi:uncharacterized protein (UPF0333 family)